MQEYIVVRWVPSTRRGEYVNVGVLVWDNTPDGIIYREGDWQRAKRLGTPPDDISFMIDRLLHNFWVIDPEWRGDFADKLRSRHRNSIQFSSPLPMAAQSLQWGVDMLYETLIAD